MFILIQYLLKRSPKKLIFANELGVSHYLIVLENNEILISEELNKIIVWEDKIDEKKITIY